jgi:hypothetical protein
MGGRSNGADGQNNETNDEHGKGSVHPESFRFGVGVNNERRQPGEVPPNQRERESIPFVLRASRHLETRFAPFCCILSIAPCPFSLWAISVRLTSKGLDPIRCPLSHSFRFYSRPSNESHDPRRSRQAITVDVFRLQALSLGIP